MKLTLFATITPLLMIAKSAAAPLMLCSILPSEICPRVQCDTSRPLYVTGDPSSCSHFVLCIRGQGIVQDCKDGMEFSEKLGACDAIDKAECKKKDCEPRDPGTLVVQTTEICPPLECDMARGLYKIGDPMNCSRFIVCVYGLPVVETCKDGKEYGEKLGECDDASKAGCKKKDCENYGALVVQKTML
ncbi:Chitin-binding domain type 2 [Elasticomyces elasticus]|nr:Chitin-binding domain type 2 [Elasticomyces elasticus]